MPLQLPPPNFSLLISVRIQTSERLFICPLAIPRLRPRSACEHFHWPTAPEQFACLGLIPKQLTQSFRCGYLSISHCWTPLRSDVVRADWVLAHLIGLLIVPFCGPVTTKCEAPVPRSAASQPALSSGRNTRPRRCGDRARSSCPARRSCHSSAVPAPRRSAGRPCH